MSALYLSMSWDQAASLPERHSLTRSVSFHLGADLADALVVALMRAGLIERRSPVHSSDTAARHSKGHRARGLPDGSCRRNFWRPPGCPGWREKSWVDTRREFPARDRRAFFAARRNAPITGPR